MLEESMSGTAKVEAVERASMIHSPTSSEKRETSDQTSTSRHWRGQFRSPARWPLGSSNRSLLAVYRAGKFVNYVFAQSKAVVQKQRSDILQASAIAMARSEEHTSELQSHSFISYA